MAALLAQPSDALAQATGQLQIHQINVGQGDAELIVSPLGQTVLIDTGPYSASSCAGPSGIVTYLVSIGLSRLDYHIASHYDADHIGCTSAVASRWPIQIAAYDRGTTSPPTTATYTNYAAAIAGTRQTAWVGQEIVLDASSAHPVRLDVVAVNGNGTAGTLAENDRSVEVVLHFGQFDAELGGDLSSTVEALVAPSIGQVELYKVHHHGSATSSSASFVTAIQPKIATLSVGATNTYGHPTAQALANLHTAGVTVYWTTSGNGATATPPQDVVANGAVVVGVPAGGATFTVLHGGITDTYASWGGTSTALVPADDYDGDGKSDLTVFRRGTWFTLKSGGGFTSGTSTMFGLDGDLPVPGDYDGDGKGDLAVFRPGNHTWYLHLSSTGSTASYGWGLGTDVPVAGDYDGDGRADLAVYRPSTGVWWILKSSSNYSVGMTLTISGTTFTDVPVPGDYDGDGLTDVAVFRPSTGTWWIWQSSTGSVVTYQWGQRGDVPVPQDYDGDKLTDMAVYRPSTGVWYIKQSTTGNSVSYQWGLPGDVPAPSDFDGDRKADLAVWRPSTGTWFVSQSSDGFGSFVAYQWGLSGDVVTPNATIARATMAARRTVANLMRNGDFDGDGNADLTVFQTVTGQWFTLESGSNFTTSAVRVWGRPSTGHDMLFGRYDRSAAGDFDGDGQTDLAVWRPTDGSWWILTSSSGYTSRLGTYTWGVFGDMPVVGDFDGDGKADLAVWRPSNGTWYILQSSAGYTMMAPQQWGLTDDVPVPGDYDGDGITDLAVYRPSEGNWYIKWSSGGFSAWSVYQWGLDGDIAVPGDYDGDGITDIAVWRRLSGYWFIRYSSTNFATSAAYQWGLRGDVPVPGDFDGDGQIDLAVFRSSTGVWYILKSSSGYRAMLAYQWAGLGGTLILGR